MLNLQKQLIVVLLLIVLTGCGKFMIRQGINLAGPEIIKNGMDTFYTEKDIEIGRAFMASSIKITEMLILLCPQNEELLNTAAMSLSSYGMCFIEYEMEEAGLRDEEGDENLMIHQRQRARDMYLKARGYGFKSLAQTRTGQKLVDAINADVIDLPIIKQHLSKIKSKQLPALFWTTAPWALYLNVARDNMSAMAMLPVLRAMITHINQLDPQYFFGMPVMFKAMLYAVAPMFGGDELKSKQAFTKISTMNKNYMFFSDVLKARFFCTQFDHPQEGIKILEMIMQADFSKIPAKYNFMNAIARKKARLYLKYADEIF